MHYQLTEEEDRFVRSMCESHSSGFSNEDYGRSARPIVERSIPGYRAEFAFKRILEQEGIISTADGWKKDIVLPTGETIDVKTAMKSSHRYITVSRIVLSRKPPSYYVGMVATDNHLLFRVRGYISFVDFMDNSVSGEKFGSGRAIELSRLKPISELLESLVQPCMF